MKHVTLAALLVCLSAQPAFAQHEKGWLDVNFGIATAAEDAYTTSVRYSLFGEPATEEATYAFPRGAAFDVGGGVMFTPVVGVGLNIQGTAHEEVPTLSISIPHPFVDGENRSATHARVLL